MFTNWLANPSAMASITTIPPNGVVASPPDVCLLVGPSPGARFVAHGTLLAMHSGYLRSAIRVNENIACNETHTTIFLSNITADQFAPVLTYMYTGYLDLNNENVFGVLLATHLLHIPRAVEICRAFLLRTQSEEFLQCDLMSRDASTNYIYGHNLSKGSRNEESKNIENIYSSISTTTNREGTTTNSTTGTGSKAGTIIRPIASKPAASNLRFLMPPISHISHSTSENPYQSLSYYHGWRSDLTLTTDATASRVSSQHEDNTNYPTNNSNTEQQISEAEKNPTPDSITTEKELKITVESNDSNGTDHVETEVDEDNDSSTSEVKKRIFSMEKSDKSAESAVPLRNEKVNRENSGAIIDIASCDGPVRFYKVLNDSFSQENDNANHPIASATCKIGVQRSKESISQSFNEQMSKNIVQQRQKHLAKSENFECENGRIMTAQFPHRSNGGEVYNCIYCKHVFKSHYCYQKHAKRHIHPLTLDLVVRDDPAITEDNPVMPDNEKKMEKGEPTPKHASNAIKRVVRPLDMNVQYYPCKTCGSKFPSYYFVHKHRKICHGNDENSGTEEKKLPNE